MKCANCGTPVAIYGHSIQYSETFTDFRIIYYFCTEACCRTWLQQRQIKQEARTNSSAQILPIRGTGR